MKDYLTKLPYWEHLTDEEQKRVQKKALICHFNPGDQLYGPCVECVGMIHVLSGIVRAYILSDEGREITLFRVEENDDCILSASCVLTHIHFVSFMTVTEPSDILVVPVALFGELCEKNVYVRCFAYELATRRFSSVVSLMQQIFFNRLDQRLATFLLQEYKRTGSCLICMTHEQIAMHIGSARESVGRTLKVFAESGMIENRRGSVLLTDLQKIRETAGASLM